MTLLPAQPASSSATCPTSFNGCVLVGKSNNAVDIGDLRPIETVQPVVLTLVLVALVVATPISGAEGPARNDRIGQRVVPKHADSLLRDEAGVLIPGPTGVKFSKPFFRVEKTDGEKLLLRFEDSNLDFWAVADQFVPIDRAIDFFTNQIRANPADPFPYMMRAMVRMEKRIELNPILRDLNEAIRLDPGSADGYLNRSEVWTRKKEFRRAIADCDQAIRLNPRLAMAFNNRGWISLKTGECDRAILDFDEAIRLDSRFSRAFCNRGNAWLAKHDCDKAVADINTAIRLNPRGSTNYCSRGRLWLVQNQHDKAVADLNEAILLEPRDGTAFIYRGIAWVAKGDPARAIADFDEAVRLEPGEFSSYLNRGLAWLKLNELEKATRDFDATLRLDPANAGAYGAGRSVVHERAIR